MDCSPVLIYPAICGKIALSLHLEGNFQTHVPKTMLAIIMLIARQTALMPGPPVYGVDGQA